VTIVKQNCSITCLRKNTILITEAKARSILLRMGVPENVINTVLLAAMRSFPKIHADFIDVANAAMHFEKVVNIIDLLSILNIEAEKRGIKLP